MMFFETVNDHLSDIESLQGNGCNGVIIASGWSVDGGNDLVQGQHAMPSCEYAAPDSYCDDSKL